MKYPNIEACNPQLCYSGKIMRMERIINSIFRKHISPFGISNSQLSLLFVIAKRKITNQHELSEMLFLEKSSVSRNVRRLLETKLVEKIDKKRIQLTEEGKKQLEKIIPAWELAMEEMNLLLGTKGKEAFETMFEKVLNH